MTTKQTTHFQLKMLLGAAFAKLRFSKGSKIQVRKSGKIAGVLILAALVTVPLWTSRFAATVSAQQGRMGMSAQGLQAKHRNSKHMHVKNWMLEPTGSPTVFPLDPNTIPKFKNQLIRLPTFVPIGTKREPSTGRNLPLYEVTEETVQIPLLPQGFPTTKSYAYGGKVNLAGPGEPANIVTAFSVPGPTFEATVNQRIFVHYINDLHGPHMFPVDPTIMAANPNNAPIPTPPFKPFPPGYQQFQEPIVTVPHLHGGVTPSDSDGFPLSWFSEDLERTGPTFSGSTFEYFNGQLPTTLWYHDHALGMTRLNIAAGLEGTYILRDPAHDTVAPLLPQGRFEVPLFIMDKAFNTDGSIHFTQVGDNPGIHPYWDPEYFGDTILVNGKVWPNLNVERRQYRFRIVNGSNARFYDLSLSNGQSFIQIGADGSYLPAPATVTDAFIAPCERADILVDFSNLPAGTKIVLTNSANAPFPGGDPVDANTGVVMQFTVQNTTPVHPRPLPSTLITIPTLVETPGIGNPKLFTLNEQESDTGDPVAVLIDGQHFDADITEIPRVGTTESWYFQNLTEDAHPIHIHLCEFQLEDRQLIQRDRFRAYWESLNGSTLPLDHPTVRANVETAVFDPATGTTHDFLTGPSEPPSPRESGWKDTFVAPPGKVTRVLIRFAPQYTKQSDLVPRFNPFPFDSTAGPGYVWHCHILDHEDNDMMRPMKITNNPPPVATNPGAFTKRRRGVAQRGGGGGR